MRKISLLLFIWGFVTSIQAQTQWKSSVDPRVELTSIVSRLAGYQEYVNNEFGIYINDVDSYFKPFESHPAVSYVKEIRESQSIGYDAIANAALHLKIDKKGVKVDPAKASLSGLGKRWTKESFAKFVKLINGFYKDTEFQKFYDKHEKLRTQVEERMNQSLQIINIDWFKDIFAEKFAFPKVYPAMGNGGSNYNIPDLTNDAGFSILIGCSLEGDEIPAFSRKLPIIVHELGHGFTRSLIENHWEEMKPYAEKIFQHGSIKEIMASNAYGSAKVMINEWITNLIVCLYLYDNKQIKEFTYGELISDYQIKGGYIWMERSVDFMKNFYANRGIYTRLDDFMPQIVGFLRYISENIQVIQSEFDNSFPYVTNVYPAMNSTIDYNTNLTEIRISFSQPMNKNIMGLRPILDENGNPDIKYATPPLLGEEFWEDSHHYVIRLRENALEPGKEYGISLPARAMQAEKSIYKMKKNYNIIFKTSEK